MSNFEYVIKLDKIEFELKQRINELEWNNSELTDENVELKQRIAEMEEQNQILTEYLAEREEPVPEDWYCTCVDNPQDERAPMLTDQDCPIHGINGTETMRNRIAELEERNDELSSIDEMLSETVENMRETIVSLTVGDSVEFDLHCPKCGDDIRQMLHANPIEGEHEYELLNRIAELEAENKKQKEWINFLLSIRPEDRIEALKKLSELIYLADKLQRGEG